VKVTIEFDEEKLIHDVMENYPEYSVCLQCEKWNYKDVTFSFRDTEDGKLHIVDMQRLRQGLQILLDHLDKGKLPGLSIDLGNFLDTGNWDADCADALVQCSLFGGVIYG
jgi:hypothetical protein